MEDDREAADRDTQDAFRVWCFAEREKVFGLRCSRYALLGRIARCVGGEREGATSRVGVKLESHLEEPTSETLSHAYVKLSFQIRPLCKSPRAKSAPRWHLNLLLNDCKRSSFRGSSESSCERNGSPRKVCHSNLMRILARNPSRNEPKSGTLVAWESLCRRLSV